MCKFELFYFIDDDDATNFFNKIIVEKANVSKENLFFRHAENALISLENDIIPDVIFLDINMPKVDGWMFLERMEKLSLAKTPSIIMLSTSINPIDYKKAEEHNLIKHFLSKPLSIEKLNIIHQIVK